MQGSVIYGPGDVRFEQRDDPTITESTDAIIKISATCVCGSDLWDYRGINQITEPTPMGHEYCGIVQAVGGARTSVGSGPASSSSARSSPPTTPAPSARPDTTPPASTGNLSVRAAPKPNTCACP